MNDRRQVLFLLLVAALGFGACGAAAAEVGGRAGAYPQALFRAIDARLEFMRDVALAKARAGTPVEDRHREAQVLERAIAAAEEAGLATDSVSDFFRAQMAAAKAIQFRYRADWQSDPDALAAGLRDLTTVVRPALLELGDTIVAELAGWLGQHGEVAPALAPAFAAEVQVVHLTAADRARLFEALTRVRLAE